MSKITTQKTVFNVNELKANCFYKITHFSYTGDKNIYNCLLKRRNNDSLTFIYAWDYNNDICFSELIIRIEDLNVYDIEIIK